MAIGVPIVARDTIVSCHDTVTTTPDFQNNSVKVHRLERTGAQEELAERAVVSRAAVRTMEGKRLIPLAATALAPARVFGCSVESLFGASSHGPFQASWADAGVCVQLVSQEARDCSS